MNTDTEREAFEAWFVRAYHPDLLLPMEAGCYLERDAGMAWDAWQARAAAGPHSAAAAPDLFAVGVAHMMEKAAAAQPVFWYRPSSGDPYAYEGPLHDSVIEPVRKESGAWVPLYAPAPPTAPEPLTSRVAELEAALRECGEALDLAFGYSLGMVASDRDWCNTVLQKERAILAGAQERT